MGVGVGAYTDSSITTQPSVHGSQSSSPFLKRGPEWETQLLTSFIKICNCEIPA